MDRSTKEEETGKAITKEELLRLLDEIEKYPINPMNIVSASWVADNAPEVPKVVMEGVEALEKLKNEILEKQKLKPEELERGRV